MAMQLSLKLCEQTDLSALNQLVSQGNHAIEPCYFETAFQEQTDKKRIIILAFQGSSLVGYAHLNFFPQYAPFVRLNIPEIQDIFVHPDLRRQGIGEQIIAACEAEARHLSFTDIGIGVGVLGHFGSAQRLYHRMGYMPDGNGAVFERIPVQSGDMRPIDDRLCLMLLKQL